MDFSKIFLKMKNHIFIGRQVYLDQELPKKTSPRFDSETHACCTVTPLTPTCHDQRFYKRISNLLPKLEVGLFKLVELTVG